MTGSGIFLTTCGSLACGKISTQGHFHFSPQSEKQPPRPASKPHLWAQQHNAHILFDQKSRVIFFFFFLLPSTQNSSFSVLALREGGQNARGIDIECEQLVKKKRKHRNRLASKASDILLANTLHAHLFKTASEFKHRVNKCQLLKTAVKRKKIITLHWPF